MKRLGWLLLLLGLAAPSAAQEFSTRQLREFHNALTPIGRFGTPGYTTALLPTCNTSNARALAYDSTLGALVVCNGTSYLALTSTAGANVFTGLVTFGSAVDAAGTIRLGETASCIVFEGSSADASEASLCATNPTADVTFNMPALSVGTYTFATLEGAQTFTNVASIALSGAGVNGYIVGTATTDGTLRFSTAATPDTPLLTTGTTANALNVMEFGDIAADMNNGPCGTAACTDPQIVVHSHNQDATQYGAVSATGFSGGMRKTLTESSATAVVQIPVAASAATGGTFNYCVFAADATDQQERCGRIKFAVTNKAATETCGLNTDTAVANDASITETEDGNATSISTGTLTYAITCDTAPTNAANIAINAVSSLTQTTLEVRYQVQLVGPGQVTPQ